MKLLVTRLPVASLFCKWPSLECVSVSDSFSAETGLPKHRFKRRRWLQFLETSGISMTVLDVAELITKAIEQGKAQSTVAFIDVFDPAAQPFTIPTYRMDIARISAFVDFSSSSVIFFFFPSLLVWDMYRNLLPVVYESVFWLNLSRRFEGLATPSLSVDPRMQAPFNETDAVCFDELCSVLVKKYLADSGIRGVSVSLAPFAKFHKCRFDLSNQFLSSPVELANVDAQLTDCLDREVDCETVLPGSDICVRAYPCFEDIAGEVVAIICFLFQQDSVRNLERASSFASSFLRPLIEEWFEVSGKYLAQSDHVPSDRLQVNDRTELRARYSQFETLAHLGNIAIVETQKIALMNEALHLFGSSLFANDAVDRTLLRRNSAIEQTRPIRTVFLVAGFDVAVEDYALKHRLPVSINNNRQSPMLSSIRNMRLGRQQIDFLMDFAVRNLPELDVAFGIRQTEIACLVRNLDIGLSEDDVAKNHELKMVRLSKRSGRQLFLGIVFHSDFRPLGDFSTFMISVAEIIVNALDRILIEKRLFQSEQQLRYIWRSVKEAMVVFREDTGAIVETNSVAEQLFEVCSESLILEDVASDAADQAEKVRKISGVYQKLDQFSKLHDTVEDVRSFVDAVASIEEENKMVTLSAHPDIQFSMNLSKTFDPVSETPLCVVVFRDVSEANRRQTAEIQALKSEAANKMKSMIVHTLSHELRNPIQGILSMSQILQDEKSLSRYQRECVGYIASATDFLLLLIADVLDSSRIESGKFVLEQKPFDILMVAEECIELVTLQSNSKKIELSVVCDPSMKFLVVGDSRRTKQVILNLLSNAVKFTPISGSVQLRISAKERHAAFPPQENLTDSGSVVLMHQFYENAPVLDESTPDVLDVEIQVVDTGVGFDQEESSLLWHPFSQLGTPTFGFSQQHLGTGLGLSISATLVKCMNGRCDAWSLGRGTGSTFAVTIPFHIQPGSRSSYASRLQDVRAYVVDNHTVPRLCVAMLGRTCELIPGIRDLMSSVTSEISEVVRGSDWESEVTVCASLAEFSSTIKRARGPMPKDSRIALFIDMDDDEGLAALAGSIQEHRRLSASGDLQKTSVFPVFVSRMHEDEILCDFRAERVLDMIASKCHVQFSVSNFLRKPSRLELIFDILWRITTCPESDLQSILQKQQPVQASGLPVSASVLSSDSSNSDFDDEDREILVVDDDAVVRKVMCLVLQKAGFKVRVAVDGKEGIDAVLERKALVERTCKGKSSCKARMFDVVLMDMVMPVKDGVEACKELRRFGLTNLPIVGCTANCLFDITADAADQKGKNGMEAFLQSTMFSDCLLKPVGKNTLIAMIDKWAPRQRP
eukprot:ANDGO_00864.mRNA.1 Hybrid signal transduction histidine kinase B